MNMFQAIFIFSGEHLENWYRFPMCISILLNFVGYFHISKCDLKLCWICFSNHTHMIGIFSWESEKFIYIPYIFLNVIQLYWKNSYVTSIHTKHSYTFPVHQCCSHIIKIYWKNSYTHHNIPQKVLQFQYVRIFHISLF